MQFIVRDNYAFTLAKLRGILARYHTLQSTPRRQLFFVLLDPLIKALPVESESLCLALLRQARGGDVTQENLFLLDNLLELLQRHHDWLDRTPQLVATAAYSYLRLLADHGRFDLLRQKEVAFCVRLIRERFAECATVGRDLVRALQEVTRLPEFAELWDDLVNSPASLSPSFQGLPALLSTPTPRRYLQSRLTPQMEEQLLFVMEHVKMGNQRRYQHWFVRNFLATPESESLIPDLVRYICDVFHPPNHILCSDIVPRWAMLGWLLKAVKAPAVLAGVKLAVFYDWLFFDPAVDSIMNIEPAMLVMYNSLPKYASITATLLEFLILISDSYFPPLAPVIRASIVASFQNILSKGVIPALEPLFESRELDERLRLRARELFLLGAAAPATSLPPSAPLQPVFLPDDPRDPEAHLSPKPSPSPTPVARRPSSQTPPPQSAPVSGAASGADALGDSDSFLYDEGPVLQGLDALPISPARQVPLGSPSAEFTDKFSSLIIALQESQEKLARTLSPESFRTCSSYLADLVAQCLAQKEGRSEWIRSLVAFVCANFEDELGKPAAAGADPGSGETQVCLPTLSDAKVIRGVTEEGVADFCVALAKAEPSFGFRYLDRIARLERRARPLRVYSQVAKTLTGGGSLAAVIIRDLELCKDAYDVRAFYSVGVLVLQEFADLVVGHAPFLRLLCSFLDFAQLQALVSRVSLGELTVIGPARLQVTTEASLGWESFEQLALWQLLSAELAGDPTRVEAFCCDLLPKVLPCEPSLFLTPPPKKK